MHLFLQNKPYMSYNAHVLEHFRLRPNDLLVLNLADPDPMNLFATSWG